MLAKVGVRHRDGGVVVLVGPNTLATDWGKKDKKEHPRDAGGSHTLSESDMSKREGLGFRLDSILKAEMVKGERMHDLQQDKGQAGPGQISGAPRVPSPARPAPL